jgi:hypothetical protein
MNKMGFKIVCEHCVSDNVIVYGNYNDVSNNENEYGEIGLDELRTSYWSSIECKDCGHIYSFES